MSQPKAQKVNLLKIRLWLHHWPAHSFIFLLPVKREFSIVEPSPTSQACSPHNGHMSYHIVHSMDWVPFFKHTAPAWLFPLAHCYSLYCNALSTWSPHQSSPPSTTIPKAPLLQPRFRSYPKIQVTFHYFEFLLVLKAGVRAKFQTLACWLLPLPTWCVGQIIKESESLIPSPENQKIKWDHVKKVPTVPGT